MLGGRGGGGGGGGGGQAALGLSTLHLSPLGLRVHQLIVGTVVPGNGRRKNVEISERNIS